MRRQFIFGKLLFTEESLVSSDSLTKFYSHRLIPARYRLTSWRQFDPLLISRSSLSVSMRFASPAIPLWGSSFTLGKEVSHLESRLNGVAWFSLKRGTWLTNTYISLKVLCASLAMDTGCFCFIPPQADQLLVYHKMLENLKLKLKKTMENNSMCFENRGK